MRAEMVSYLLYNGNLITYHVHYVSSVRRRAFRTSLRIVMEVPWTICGGDLDDW